MNIHEHQAKQILKKYGAIVPEGVFALTVDELLEKVKLLNKSLENHLLIFKGDPLKILNEFIIL